MVSRDLAVNLTVDANGGAPTYAVVAQTVDGWAGGHTGDYANPRQFDTALADSLGVSAPVLQGAHEESPGFPSTFSGTEIYPDYTYGLNTLGVHNFKTDWQDLASGALDSHIENFINSIPSGFKLYLILNHEPENDPSSKGTHGDWQDATAHAANLVASINDPRCEFAFCLMDFTWQSASGRNPNDWNPADAPNVTMTQAAMDKTIFAPDGYIDSTGPNARETLHERFDDLWTSAQQWGFHRFAVSEWAFRDGNPSEYFTDAETVDVWNNYLIPYWDSVAAMPGIEFVYNAIFNTGYGAIHADTMPLTLHNYGLWCQRQAANRA